MTTRERLRELLLADPSRSSYSYAEGLGVSPGRIIQILREEGYTWVSRWELVDHLPGCALIGQTAGGSCPLCHAGARRRG